MKEKDFYKRKGRKHKKKIEKSVEKLKIENFFEYTFFYNKSFCKKNKPQKPQNPKKILRKSPASDAWTAIFKNADVF